MKIFLDFFVSLWLLWTDLGVYMIIYGINYALVYIRPEMAVKFRFTK